MRRNSFFIPALAMGLLYASLYMGLLIINLRGTAREGRGDFGALFHFALVALVGVGLYFAIKKGSGISFGRLRPLAAFIAVAGLICMAVPFFPEPMLSQIFNGRLPIIGICMAVFTPVSFFLFFRAAPLGREGFYFGLVMGGGELLWALLFPLLGFMDSQLPGEQAAYLFLLCCYMTGGAGIALAVTLVQAAREPDAAKESDPAAPYAATRHAITQSAQAGLLPPEKRAALGLIFVAGVSIFAFMGLHMGMFMPKIALKPELLSIPHFAFLLLLPLAGRYLDTKPDKLMPVCVLSIAAIFLLGLLYTYGLVGRMPLFYPLNIVQHIILLAIYTVTARLLKTHSLLPLLIILAYCLYPVQLGGAALRGLSQGLSFEIGITAASLLFAAATAYCLWRFGDLLTKKPELWALPRTENMTGTATEPASGPTTHPSGPAQEIAAIHPALHASHLAAFAAAYGLSEQEIRVMDMLAQNRSTNDIATALAVKTSTVRTYIVRLMDKTGSGNRAALMARYAAYSAATPEAHSA
ncbi:MAG: helix-turn-helix transcriptional regulator [Deltaproteobacteria bacterium]|jgi:DNA-binding CsgD family transcriptional regulator|nr:helix-turn-helix transcriptional regulator [Deltaproteobacteria bacterium]